MRQNRSGVRRPAERETTRGEGIRGDEPGWIDGGVLRSGIEGRGWWGKVGEVLREGNTAPPRNTRSVAFSHLSCGTTTTTGASELLLPLLQLSLGHLQLTEEL